MNELELTVFTYSLEKVGWDFPCEIIDSRQFLVDLSPYASYTKAGLDTLHLHLCCLGFMVKQKLNEKSEYELIQFYLERKVYSNFAELYRGWSSHFKSQFNVEPIGLNRVFNRLSFVNWNGSNDKVDYNALVDAIIDISPPYSGRDEGLLGKEEEPSRRKSSKTAKTNDKMKFQESQSENEEESLLKARQYSSESVVKAQNGGFGSPSKKKNQENETKMDAKNKRQQRKKKSTDQTAGILHLKHVELI